MKKLVVLMCALALSSCSNKFKEVVNSEADYNVIPNSKFNGNTNGKFLVA